MKAGIDGAIPLGPGVRVVERAEGILLALEKPAGVLAHPNRPGIARGALLQALYDAEAECYAWAEGGRQLWLCHRLDSPTSGIILLAETEEAAQAVRKAFASGQVEKTYIAVVAGKFTGKGEVTWKDTLERANLGGTLRVRVGSGRGGQAAAVRVAGESWEDSRIGPLSRLRLRPLTGRTHQLRVQCAHHGLPIVGDQTYGDFAFNRRLVRAGGEKRLFLHAREIRVPPLSEVGLLRPFRAESPMPEAFLRPLPPG